MDGTHENVDDVCYVEAHGIPFLFGEARVDRMEVDEDGVALQVGFVMKRGVDDGAFSTAGPLLLEFTASTYNMPKMAADGWKARKVMQPRPKQKHTDSTCRPKRPQPGSGCWGTFTQRLKRMAETPSIHQSQAAKRGLQQEKSLYKHWSSRRFYTGAATEPPLLLH